MGRHEQIIAALEEKYSKILGAAFFDAMSGLTDNAIFMDLVGLIERNDIPGAITLLSIHDTAFDAVIERTRDAFAEGGRSIAATLPRGGGGSGIRTVFRFDMRNARAEMWLKRHATEFITGDLTETARDVVSSTMERGLAEGRNPRSVALDIVGRMDPLKKRRIGGVLPLTRNGATSVLRLQDELAAGDYTNYFSRKMRDRRFDGPVRRAMEDGDPLPADIRTKIVGRYSDNLLRLRGETIARTEANTALGQAQHEAFQQAIDAGSIKDSKKEWDTSGDGRVRRDHASLDGVTVDMNEPFVDAAGNRMLYPRDRSLGASAETTINCRCRVKYKVDYFEGVT